MSHRLSITSSASHVDGRNLPPMKGNTPNMRRLRTCRSIEWVYNKDDESCSTPKLGRIILRVGETITIFPDDSRAVAEKDGSLPIMSYWYGKITKICLKPQGQTHDVWLEIQWFYRKVDLEDVGVNLAQSMGDYELVLSDHKSFVDITCVEDHAMILSYNEGDLSQLEIPPETLYHRWNINITFVKSRKDVRIRSVNLNNPQRATQCRCNNCDHELYCPSIAQRYCRKCRQWFNDECLDTLERRVDRHPAPISPDVYGNIDVDEEFLAMLTLPICRGGPYGVVGNGSIYARAKSMLHDGKIHGKLPEEWRNILMDAESLDYEGLSYYKCPCCVDVLC
ncbi:hypothetical protein DFJ58DRAFT_875000 [Suillus subalutaceus]|uniref:uncharacterized protein n=1 Tax=Suillus subalutaceus TaxID=48586 RepID=UPI001B876DE4|nr:uncharacterized protein DFJ58DRAFT_875000 [Suillus subalutaceus]KAG1829887.1 hypothetical protein DFJ58DRAFT_875000 [Suillus subalutaceus]